VSKKKSIPKTMSTVEIFREKEEEEKKVELDSNERLESRC
jgi:hypothetical protein